MSGLIQRASRFALTAHQSIDQRRKYSNEPYIVHPRAVARLVSTVTDDQAMISAAWLHDVVEDTPVTIGEIESEFGADVAALVDDLTDVSCRSDGNRSSRLAKDRQHTSAASPRAKTVKLADVIDNLGGVVEADLDFARKFVREREALIGVLGEGDPTLLAMAIETIEECHRKIANRNSVS
ncbi:HD domain-containing protein [Mariniblastus sp.]|jgi:(p)ppGpp synthase/HD superfamily hydrolase|nr:HD domain-containing protein [Mariniblastus sp.]MDB4756133.1 HD domain-containing protein [Mariniblastus sp.]